MVLITSTFLGTFSVRRDDERIITFRSDKVRALLAYLAVESDRPHARASLAALFWPEHPQDSALNNLSQTLGRLRESLGPVEPPALLITRQTVAWNPACPAEVDILHFTKLAHSAVIADLEAAAALYAGPFLPGFALADCQEFEEWLTLTREHLERLALQVLDTLARAYLEARSYAAAEATARRQVAIDSWRESAHRQVMEALARAGERNAALAHYGACRSVLEEELGVEPDPATTALYERIRDGELAPPASGAAAPHNLPAALTPTVGREAELAELRALLGTPQTRLLTLVGAGGMGKTRLALELAWSQLDRFSDGVFLVTLAHLADASAIAPALAATLGVTVHGGDLRQAILDVLRDRRALLVMDNFEHLLGGAELVVDILQAAPEVRIVATSREPLNVRGEHLYMVEGLAYATSERAGEPRGQGPNPAARLFVQSARRVQPGFAVSATNRADVLCICRLVQGMPLALELAAAWTVTLQPAEIAAEIERSVDFLASEWRGVPERQQSIRAVFDWSWRLLSEAERRALRQLTAFRGGFSREAAEAVAGASLRLLASLVRKSLLHPVAAVGAAGRYDIHQLLSQFAAEQLDALPEERQAVEARHAAYYLALAEDADEKLAGPEQRRWLDALDAEHDNFRIALRRELERGEVDLGLRMGQALGVYWSTRGYLTEGLAWLEGFLSLEGAEARTMERARALFSAGRVAYTARDHGSARSLFLECLAISRELGDTFDVASALTWLGHTALAQGDANDAERYYAESLPLRVEQGDKRYIAFTLNGLARVAQQRGEYDTARSWLLEGAELLGEAGDSIQYGSMLTALGFLELTAGNHGKAAEYLRESLLTRWEAGDRYGTAIALEALGALAGTRRDAAQAAFFFGAAHGLYEAAGGASWFSGRPRPESYWSAARDQLGEDGWLAAELDGRAMPLERTVAVADEWAASVSRQSSALPS